MESDDGVFLFILLLTILAAWEIVPALLRRRGVSIRELDGDDIAVYTVLTFMAVGGLVMLFSLPAEILVLVILAVLIWDWRRRVRRRERASSVLGCLAEVFGSDEVVARAMRLDRSLIAQWRRGWIPEVNAWNRIAELYGLVQAFKAEYSSADILSWRDQPNPHLENHSPLIMVRSGQTRDVLRAIEENDACLPRQSRAP